MRKFATVFILFPIIVFLLNGCTAPVEDGLPGDESDPSYYHSTGWRDDPQHGGDFFTNPQNCNACHGEDLKGGPSGVSCVACHAENLHHDGDVNPSCYDCHHENDISDCEGCHPDCRPGSHPTHTTVNSKGPATALVCADCHDTNNYPSFGAADAAETLADTDVCNNCHSPGGFYNGINDDTETDSVGAKDNWAEGVYDGATLKVNKEKWCVGCHDDVPGTSQQDGGGPTAPNIAGDEPTYGFYVSGHGRPPSATSKECLDCHDATVDHIDGDPRTYAVSGNYRAGYRLNDDMAVPRNGEVHPAAFKLCTNCHVYSDLVDTDSILTNFREGDVAPIPPGDNYHQYHLENWTTLVDWDSDYDGTLDSAISCTACHNVHGSPMDDGSGGLWANPVMIRHGELIGHVPAFDFWWKDDVGAFTSILDDSWESSLLCGNFFVGGAAELAVNHVCTGCHTSGRITYNRTPWHLLP